jgi:hypothetical protein
LKPPVPEIIGAFESGNGTTALTLSLSLRERRGEGAIRMREGPFGLVDDKQVRVFKEDGALRERRVCH